MFTQRGERDLILLKRILNRMREDESVNDMAVALVMTECRFRTLPIRLIEIFAIIFILYYKKQEPKLTIGKCQVEFKYWRNMFGDNNIRLIFATFDDVANYQVCCASLKERKCDHSNILVIYNRRPSTLYAKTYQRNLAIVRRTRLSKSYSDLAG